MILNTVLNKWEKDEKNTVDKLIDDFLARRIMQKRSYFM